MFPLLSTENEVRQWSSVDISLEQLHSQTVKARKLKFWDMVCLPPNVMCQMLLVTCHVLFVMCHMWHIKCHLFFYGQSGETSMWRVCYQQRSYPVFFQAFLFVWFSGLLVLSLQTSLLCIVGADDMSQVTCDMWQVTHEGDEWQMARDRWQVT